MQKISFQQQVLFGFGLTFMVVFLLAVVSYMSIVDQQEDLKWVDHTERMISLNYKIQQTLTDAETAERGYVITGTDNFLDSYVFAVSQITPYLHELRAASANDAGHGKNIDSLNYYVTSKIQIMDRIISGEKSSHRGGVSTLKSEVGKSGYYMAKIHEYVQRIAARESSLLGQRRAERDAGNKRTITIILLGSLIILGLLILIFSFIKKTFRHQKQIEERIREANIQLRHVSEENEKKNRLLSGASKIESAMRGEVETEVLCQKVLNSLAAYTEAGTGALYLVNDSGRLKLAAGYAFTLNEERARILGMGEGLPGQAAAEKRTIILSDVTPETVSITTGTLNIKPLALILQPVIFEDQVVAVLELGFVNQPSQEIVDFVRRITDAVGIGINTAKARVRLRDLYLQTQQQTEELASQHEELRTINEDLLNKTAQLQASEEELTVQQEELRQMNAELEEKAEMLEERNRVIEEAKEAINIKAQELEQSGKYKSEFLANMSHELRTPLNSILILAKILKENKQSNLTPDQIKYAGVIHNAGSDLLTLINDILDLTKIESGKLDLTIEKVDPNELKKDMLLLFDEVAKDKKIHFSCDISSDLPNAFTSDRIRIEQILKNLLSNAFKFTPEKGKVKLEVSFAPSGTVFNNERLKQAKEVIAFHVSDTGIGIPEDKQQVVFESFKQADGSISRKYGGTGLGLSICRELSRLLNGEIQVKSAINQGSTFTLFLPAEMPVEMISGKEEKKDELPEKQVHSEREFFQGDHGQQKKEIHTLLIIEDDENFAGILTDQATERGFDVLVAHRGDTGLQMALEHLPDAIILDLMLPVIDGWTVLKKLKEDSRTKDIPVHLMSAGDEKKSKVKRSGAIGFLHKPVDKDQLDEVFENLKKDERVSKVRKVLIVEDQKAINDVLSQELKIRGVDVVQAFDGKETMEILGQENDFDCIILDLKLPDSSGVELLEQIRASDKLSDIPVVIHTAMELDKDSMEVAMKYTQAMVLKTDKSGSRLLDEVSLFMNKVRTGSAVPKSQILGKPAKGNSTMEKALKGKCVLIADDDMRNIFALSSALQEFDMVIEVANDGREALTKLESMPSVDIVLMDIMMPEMDGYEAIREIRKNKRYDKLPVIALTAKAMSSDRDKCIEAGANEYISKPLDVNKLLSMMRVWLS